MRLLLIALLLTGCGATQTGDTDDSRGSSEQQRLAKAMCSDLEDGASMFQMHSQAVEFYTELGRSPDAAQLAAATIEDIATGDYCPEFRDEFEATFAYEDWIAP